MQIWESLRQYLADLSWLGLLLLVSVVLDGLGAYEYVSGRQISPLPSWSFFLFASLVFLIAPFMAYHKMRVKVRDATDTRHRELSRLVLRTRNAAGKLVMLKDAGPELNVEADAASARYLEAIDDLRTEAEIEGGSVKQALSQFATFVGFHVARLVGGMPVYGGGAREVDLDIYQFLGRMASRAEEVIKKIRRSI